MTACRWCLSLLQLKVFPDMLQNSLTLLMRHWPKSWPGCDSLCMQSCILFSALTVTFQG